MTIYHQDTLEPKPNTHVPDPHQDTFSKTLLGFWLYLMSDCLIFTSLFAAYAVLRHATFGGPTAKELFSIPFTFTETMLLLASSVTCGFAVLDSLKNNLNRVFLWLGATFVLGALFISLELHEFYSLVQEGHSWEKSAFLSSFFTLVGTHGLHVSFGLLWLALLALQLFKMGITVTTFRRLVLFSLFWHFLDLIWIFIFTFVYLMGVI